MRGPLESLRLTGRSLLVAFALGGGLLYLVVMVGGVLLFGPAVPRAGWLLFGVVAAVVVTLSSGAAVFLVRQSRNAGARPPSPRQAGAGAEPRILILADRGCEDPRACRPLAQHVAGRHGDVVVVAPALGSPIHYLASDIDRDAAAAGTRLAATIATLASYGIEASGTVGSENPLEAIADAYAETAADEIVIATAPERELNWLERDVVTRTRQLYDVPVTHIVLDARPSTANAIG